MTAHLEMKGGGRQDDCVAYSVDKDEKDDKMAWSAYTYQVIIVGAGFLADAYDLFVIDLVISILSRLHPGGLGPHDKSLIASATLVGAIVGQLLFGVLGDWIGRRGTFLATCVLIVLGAVASGCVVWVEDPASPFGLVRQLALCRFLLGVGVGGEYPLAATICAEGAPTASRGRLIAGVFSMQGWGMLLSCLLVLLLLAAGAPLEFIWRFVLIFGAIPSAAVIYTRTDMEETEMYKDTHQEQVGFGEHIRASAGHVRKYWRLMVGTTMTWLLLDVTFYGTGSFKHRVHDSLSDTHVPDARDQIWEEAVFATMCSCLAIPGYLLSVAYVDRIGRFNLQFFGFLALAANFSLLVFFINRGIGDRYLLLFTFGLTFLFSNFGPNMTTFMLPAEIYPTAVRATCHGISAAFGKVGAVIGAVAFSPVEAAHGIEIVLGGCSIVCLTGAVFTYSFTPRDSAGDLRELDGFVPAPRDKPTAP